MLTYMHPEAVKKFAEANHLDGMTPSFETLVKLGNAFGRMPYENLTKIIRKNSIDDPAAAIRLPELLYEEHLRFGTGGTCFSMTYFMQTILKSFGFDTYPVMADRPLAPKTHCASIILLDGKKYILDPGFIINRPLPLTRTPQRHRLPHNDIIIGAKGAIPVPAHQMRYFEDYEKRGHVILREERPKNPVLNPLKRWIPRYSRDDTHFKNNRFLGNDMACENAVADYTLATATGSKITIRYFLEEKPVSPDEFLKFWLDSFDWPGLRSTSITVATEKGYIYARNNFLRRTTKEGKKQERLRNKIGTTLGSVFNIDPKIIENALQILNK